MLYEADEKQLPWWFPALGIPEEPWSQVLLPGLPHGSSHINISISLSLAVHHFQRDCNSPHLESLTTQGACHLNQKIAAVQHRVGGKGSCRTCYRSCPGIPLCWRLAGRGWRRWLFWEPNKGRHCSWAYQLVSDSPAANVPWSDHSWPKDTLSSAFSAWNSPRFQEHMVRRRGQLWDREGSWFFAFPQDELFFHNLIVLIAFQVVKLIWSLCRSGWRADRGRGGWRRQQLLAGCMPPPAVPSLTGQLCNCSWQIIDWSHWISLSFLSAPSSKIALFVSLLEVI